MTPRARIGGLPVTKKKIDELARDLLASLSNKGPAATLVALDWLEAQCERDTSPIFVRAREIVRNGR